MERAKTRIATRKRLHESSPASNIGENEEFFTSLLPLLLTTVPQEEAVEQSECFEFFNIGRRVPIGIQGLLLVLGQFVHLTFAQHDTSNEFHKPPHRLWCHPIGIDSANATDSKNKTIIGSDWVERSSVNQWPVDMEVFIFPKKMIDVVRSKDAFKPFVGISLAGSGSKE